LFRGGGIFRAGAIITRAIDKGILWRALRLHMRTGTIPSAPRSTQSATARAARIGHAGGARGILLLLMGEIDLCEELCRQVEFVIGAVVGC
jgi:hypothetical protein